MAAIRQQLSRALDLIVQIERFNDGARRVTNITEVQRMEGDTVTLQDIFEYKIDRESNDGKGQLVYSGLRPTCHKFERNSVPLPAYMDQHNFGGGSQAGGIGQPTGVPMTGVAQGNFAIRPGRVDRRFGR